MTQTYITPDSPRPLDIESAGPAISWAGVLAGVFVTLAATGTLTVLGTGLGLAARAPFEDAGAAKTLGVASVIWMIVVSWIASALGGYMTGRLRTRWVNVHTHEVYFRDTAHGFVTWAVATVLLAAVLTSFGGMAAHHGAHMAHPMMHAGAPREEGAHGPMGPVGVMNPMAYYADSLFRAPTGATTPAANNQDAKDEAERILAKGLKNDSLPEDDKAYLAQLVSTRTGLADADARQRVDSVLARENTDEAQMKELADNARKTGATLAICLALSMMVGAFVSSVAAALGGNIRDRHN